jgi:hypothetical protein
MLTENLQNLLRCNQTYILYHKWEDKLSEQAQKEHQRSLSYQNVFAAEQEFKIWQAEVSLQDQQYNESSHFIVNFGVTSLLFHKVYPLERLVEACKVGRNYPQHFCSVQLIEEEEVGEELNAKRSNTY